MKCGSIWFLKMVAGFITNMVKCFLCGMMGETRKVFMGHARGYSDLCFDCVIKFYKIQTEQ
jgi:hypothetical protein